MTGSTTLPARCLVHPGVTLLYLYHDGRASVWECPECVPPALIRIQSRGVAAFQPRVARDGAENPPDGDRDVSEVAHGHHDTAETAPRSPKDAAETFPKGG